MIIEALSACAGLGVAIAVWRFHPRANRSAPSDRCQPAVLLLLDMLTDGRDWRIDRYRADHPTGASVWVGNGPDSAGLSLTGQSWPNGSGKAGNIATTARERKALYEAAIKLREAKVVDAARAETAAWAARVSEYADRIVERNGGDPGVGRGAQDPRGIAA